MASNVVVIDSSFRRVTIKVNPGKYMTEVLEEACEKLKLRSTSYGLKNKNKTVDLSRTFRQTGLVSGAKLELVQASQTPSAVLVALQLPPDPASGAVASRMTDTVPSDTTIWRVLRHFEAKDGQNLNFTGRGTAQVANGDSGAGRIFYEMPTATVINRDLSTFAELQKTLAQLGINSGNTLIRLSFKKTEQPLEEAMVEIGQYFKEEEAPRSEPTQSPEVEPVTQAIENLQAPEETNKTSETSDPTSNPEAQSSSSITDAPTPNNTLKRTASARDFPSDQPPGPGNRLVSVFRPPTSDTPLAATVPHNEADYEPSIAHAKLHQASLLNRTQNQRLLSDAEAEKADAERKAKLATTKSVVIKVRFPDQSSVITGFTAEDSGASLHTFVRGVIEAESDSFKLVWNSKGVMSVPDDSSKLLIKDLGFEKSVLVNFLWGDEASPSSRNQMVLKKEYVEMAKNIAVPAVPGADVEDEKEPAVKVEKKTTGEPGAKKGGNLSKWVKGLSKK